VTQHKVSAEGIVEQDTSAEINKLLVKIWDLGPRAPETPVKPELPQGKEGSAQHDLAMIDFRAGLSQYETALKAYAQEKKDFDEWHRVYAGPYQIEMYSANAREALQNDPERYAVELPKGRKPGKWHADEQQRQAEHRRTFAQMVARDPVFGSQGASP
jgi:secreted Zn-dependent insulinase-like peptidase